MRLKLLFAFCLLPFAFGLAGCQTTQQTIPAPIPIQCGPSDSPISDLPSPISDPLR